MSRFLITSSLNLLETLPVLAVGGTTGLSCFEIIYITNPGVHRDTFIYTCTKITILPPVLLIFIMSRHTLHSTLGCFGSNLVARNIIPRIGDILQRVLPILASIKQDNLRWSFAASKWVSCIWANSVFCYLSMLPPRLIMAHAKVLGLRYIMTVLLSMIFIHILWRFRFGPFCRCYPLVGGKQRPAWGGNRGRFLASCLVLLNYDVQVNTNCFLQ